MSPDVFLLLEAGLAEDIVSQLLVLVSQNFFSFLDLTKDLGRVQISVFIWMILFHLELVSLFNILLSGFLGVWAK